MISLLLLLEMSNIFHAFISLVRWCHLKILVSVTENTPWAQWTLTDFLNHQLIGRSLTKPPQKMSSALQDDMLPLSHSDVSFSFSLFCPSGNQKMVMKGANNPLFFLYLLTPKHLISEDGFGFGRCMRIWSHSSKFWTRTLSERFTKIQVVEEIIKARCVSKWHL